MKKIIFQFAQNFQNITDETKIYKTKVEYKMKFEIEKFNFYNVWLIIPKTEHLYIDNFLL